MLSMTFGKMPTREQYDAAWDKTFEDADSSDNFFSFGNDKRVGNCDLTQDELWDELNKAYQEYLKTDYFDFFEGPGVWISSVLSCLGIEWI